jgi:acyl-CoA thioesterase-1
VVILGDSLTAGYGLPSKELAFPALLQKDVDAAGFNYEVVNMGVSGDTTAGGLRRLDWAMAGDVRIVVVALGGNDGLRGLGPGQVQQNLAAIIDGARARGAQVLLCGMEAPPNLGAKYTDEFREAYRRLAEAKGVPLVPFLLDGVAGVAEFNQPDGIHPNEAGAKRVAALVWTALRPLLEARSTS